jgi:DNA-binding NarL/FixJ family response regulator
VLYDLLQPYRGQIVVTGAAVACHGAAAHYLGLLAATLARWDAARTHFEEALALHSRMGARPWIAVTQYQYADLLLARGGAADQAEAWKFVTAALGAAREMDMADLAARALALIERLEPARPATSQPEQRHQGALTAREQEVARLLARGLTNRQIAGALVISERTADAHVANIFGKLGFNTRAQVAAWAVEAGLHSAAGS